MKNSAQARLLTTRHERELMSLRDLSARVGGDPLLGQASNGNTSTKLGGILWIKASGKWLAHAMQEEMFVPLELAEVQQSVQSGTNIGSQYTAMDSVRNIRYATSPRNRRQWPLHLRRTCSYLETTGWSSVGLTVIQPKHFCGKSNDGLRLFPEDSQNPTRRC